MPHDTPLLGDCGCDGSGGALSAMIHRHAVILPLLLLAQLCGSDRCTGGSDSDLTIENLTEIVRMAQSEIRSGSITYVRRQWLRKDGREGLSPQIAALSHIDVASPSIPPSYWDHHTLIFSKDNQDSLRYRDTITSLMDLSELSQVAIDRNCLAFKKVYTSDGRIVRMRTVCKGQRYPTFENQFVNSEGRDAYIWPMLESVCNLGLSRILTEDTPTDMKPPQIAEINGSVVTIERWWDLEPHVGEGFWVGRNVVETIDLEKGGRSLNQKGYIPHPPNEYREELSGETTFGNYKTFGGIWYPTHVISKGFDYVLDENRRTMVRILELIIESAEFNIEVDESLFAQTPKKGDWVYDFTVGPRPLDYLQKTD